MAAGSNTTPLIVIVGETASGKSALAMKLAERFSGEIIAADAWTVYRGFDIGTAKPSKADQAQVPHHLIDIRDPAEGFNAALFKPLAQAAIKNIAGRGKLPILVGGTGLYIDSVLYDYKFLPEPDPSLREALNELSIEQLLAKIESGRINTSGIDLRNKRRLIRLIENNGQRPSRGNLRPNTLVIGIKIATSDLEKKITKRVDAMVEAGFADEVKKLGGKYDWDNEAFKAPGYRAFKEYVLGNIALEEAKFRFVRNDLKLAKKQRTWFKRNKSIHWVDKQREAVELTTTFLNKIRT